MAYIKNEPLIGKSVTTNRKLESCGGYFTAGTRVKIIACGDRGYDIEDASGNRMMECGYDFFDKASVSDSE